MKASKVITIVVTILSVVLYFVFSLINFKNGGMGKIPASFVEPQGNHIWLNIAEIAYMALVVAAILYALKEKKYLVGILLSGIKITFPKGDHFLTTLVDGQAIDFTNVSMIFGMLFTILSVVIIVLLIYEVIDYEYQNVEFKVHHFIDPIIVLAFLTVFYTFEKGFIYSMAELISFSLLAIMSAEFLFISVFIATPFHMVDHFTTNNGNTTTFWHIAYWAIGITLLIYGIYALIHRFVTCQDKNKACIVEV